MSYPFVQAFNDYGPRKGPVLAFLVHMAEGGGTVGFLSRDNARGVSVHYVIERSGRIVQMLLESRASGSVNPRDIRTTEGPAPFGISVARAVLSSWVKDPNSAVISLEIEGYAKDGPNEDQVAALIRLVGDVRSRYPNIGLLGHRDFVDYKACPGSRIPWAALGGHGPATIATPEPDDVTIPLSVNSLAAYDVTIKAGTQLYDQAFRPLVKMSQDAIVDGLLATGTGYIGINIVTGGVRQLAFVKSGAVAYGPKPAAPAPLSVEVAANGKIVGTITLP